MYRNMENAFDGGLSYQELHSLLDAVHDVNRSSPGQEPSLYISTIIGTLLPCDWGWIGGFERETNTTHPVISFGANNKQKSGLEQGIFSQSVFYGELLVNWLNTQSLLFMKYPTQVQSQGPDAQFRKTSGNMIFDAVLNNDSRTGCFCYLVNIDPALLRKYRIVTRLLLTLMGDALKRIPAESAAGINETIELTDREQEIIARIRVGLNNKNIARQLNISVNTVKSHIYNIFQKLQASNRVEALLKAQQAGY